MEEMKRKEEKTEKRMAEVMAQNRRMTEPLQRTKEDVAELQKQLAHYEKDKASLAVSVVHTELLRCLTGLTQRDIQGDLGVIHEIRFGP